jgi:hypothetical protein
MDTLAANKNAPLERKGVNKRSELR